MSHPSMSAMLIKQAKNRYERIYWQGAQICHEQK